MATVHIGRLLGPVGFARTVAIKRLHPQYAKDPELVSMFLDEARLAARIQHPNVCATLDVVATQGELFLVMEYLQGETLSRLIRATRNRGEFIHPRVVVTIIAQGLHGLHAAHEAKSERGEALHIVHRDFSPQNLLIGRDGATKVLDFGVAKAAGRFHTTREGNVKGKLPYMSPEQLRGQAIDRQTDVYAAAVCLWEALTGRKLFKGDNEGNLLEQVLFGAVEPPSHYVPSLPPELDALVMRGLDRDKTKRFATAREFALALERTVHPALASDVGEWVDGIAGQALNERAERVAEIESVTDNVPAIGLTEVMNGYDASGAVPVSSGMLPNSDGISSQVSSISVAAGDRSSLGTSPRRRAGVLVGVAIGVLTLLTIGIAIGISAAGPGKSSATASPPPSAEAPATSAPAFIAQPPPTYVATATATQSASAASAVTTTTTPPPPATNRGVVHPVVKPVEGKSDDCKIPYTVGPNGERIYKRHCFQ